MGTSPARQVEPYPGAVNKNLRALIENHLAGASGARYVVLEGGSRSGKTWSVCEYLASLAAQHAGLKIGCFRFDAARHDDGAVADLRSVLGRLGLRSVKENKQAKEFTFANGSVIKFKGTQDVLRLHGPAWDVAWINEAMEVSKEAFDQLDQRTSGLMILDFNPSVTRHWVFDVLLDAKSPLAARTSYVHSTFADNPHLSSAIVAKIRSYNPEDEANTATADRYMWDVYGLGRRGRREGAVFTNWELCYNWPDRFACRKWGYGLDFGFSQDPSALIECAHWQGRLYLREVVYERGLVVVDNPDFPGAASLVRKMREAKVPTDANIHADCADPESIRVMQLSGFHVVPTTKTPDSIENGLTLLRSQPIMVHVGSPNLQREFENYTWKAAPRGRTESQLLAKPIDEWNHGIDAARYWALRNLRSLETWHDDQQRGSRADAFSTPLARW